MPASKQFLIVETYKKTKKVFAPNPKEALEAPHIGTSEMEFVHLEVREV